MRMHLSQPVERMGWVMGCCRRKQRFRERLFSCIYWLVGTLYLFPSTHMIKEREEVSRLALWFFLKKLLTQLKCHWLPPDVAHRQDWRC